MRNTERPAPPVEPPECLAFAVSSPSRPEHAGIRHNDV